MCVCLWRKESGASSFVHPYPLLIWRQQFCVCVGDGDCVIYCKLAYISSWTHVSSVGNERERLPPVFCATSLSCQATQSLLQPPRWSWKLHWIPVLFQHVSYAQQECSAQHRKKKWGGKLVILNQMNEWLGVESWIPHVNEKQQKNPKEITSHQL